MNNFKLSNKKVYNDKRSSIENIHEEKMKEIDEEYNSLNLKKNKLKNLNEIYFVLLESKSEDKINKRYDIKNEIEKLEQQIYKIENNTELIDYLSKALPFIMTIDDKEDTSVCDKVESENKKDEPGILNYVNKVGKTNKGKQYSKFIDTCFNSTEIDNSFDVDTNICKLCDSREFENDYKENTKICVKCGFISGTSTYNDISNLNYAESFIVENTQQPFYYQRLNHFKEWLNQLQGREVTVIPDTVIELVLLEIKKERITDINCITSIKIKSYLKKLKLNKYYEHIPNLINRITKKPPLEISSEFYNVLIDLFNKIQEPFKNHCPKSRKNFLSYSYTLHKFCQLLGKTDYLIYFPLLKSREKLFEQEKIWKGICSDLNWKFVASI